ncbi:hypothetical protein F183_A30270 [Bryobacterales bacterium F-183]|nr:hypothetical protein F183_A30270 [Bryobacterales bacterium F-183]
MEQLLKELTSRLRSQYGQRLVSVVLYGSAADGSGEKEFSDLNILCVLDHVDAKALAASEPVFRWWRENKQPAPLLMSVEEVRASTDCFPIEFQDMRDRRRVLEGRDIVSELIIDFSFHRAQVEHELRTNVLKLRQQATPLLSKPADLLRLCAAALSTFCVLGRHALLLSGVRVNPRKREIIESLRGKLGRDFSAFETLLAVREGKPTGQDRDALALFDAYVSEIQSIAVFVDKLEMGDSL